MNAHRRSLLLFTGAASLVCLQCGNAPTPAANDPHQAASASASVAAPPASAPALSGSASTSAAPAASGHPADKREHGDWAYAGAEGPDHWGSLAAEWSTCKDGKSQSPIDVPGKAEKGKDLKPLVFHYAPLPLEIRHHHNTIQVKNTVAAKVEAAGDTWELQQFHFHAPSEHTVDGKKADMELHLVHKNAKGQLLVVGVALRKGKENAALKAVFDNAPTADSHETKSVANTKIDLSSFVPARSAYSTYPGSLTTPPCSEGVSWFFLQKSAEVSEAQIAKFRSTTHGADTARPVQPLGERKVLRYKP
jgi:carbonic anhydrase